MSKVVPIDRARRARTIRERAIRDALRKVHRSVAEDFALRTDALQVLETYLGRLIEIAPSSRLVDLAYSVAYITTELDLTLANIKVVLICCQCLDQQYRAARASA
jgi:hypothetical protein